MLLTLTVEAAPCPNASELQRDGHLDLLVHFDTRNAALTIAFKRALNYWAGILDMEWHDVGHRDCVVEVTGTAEDFFRLREVARAMPSGWIAFNPDFTLNARQLYVVSIHELAHLFGAPHNRDRRSVMASGDQRGDEILLADDLLSIAQKHKLRILKQ